MAHGCRDRLVIDGRDWPGALDAFEARLHDQLQALSAGADPTVPPFEAPQMTVPLPLHLSERAQVLMQRCHDIEADLAMALADVDASLRRVAEEPAPSAGEQEPVYFDSRI